MIRLATLVPLAAVLAPALLLPPRRVEARPCDVVGTVRDADGKPVEDLPVRLEAGGKPREASTDAEGRFRFTGVSGPAEVIASLRDADERPRFAIVEGNEPVELRATVDPASTCELALGPDSRARAGDLLVLHQNLRRGFLLFDRLGIRRGPSLRVEASDPVAAPDAAHWVGTWSFNPGDVQPPRVVLGTAATRRTDPGAPDDREYHELGHHALATAFGALPRAREHVDGGGYHLDATSTAAWTEGFAVFFAALVAREIEERPDAGLHRVEGAWLDLELDYQPWDLRGTEELAVASLLWDVVDGDREDRPAPLTVDSATVIADAGVPRLLVARVHNPSPAPVARAYVRVDGPGVQATVPVAPAVLAPGAEGWIALPLPDAAPKLDDDRLRLHALATPGATDDDPVQIDPPQLWAAIAEFRSEQPEANGRLFDVADLYQALRGRFGEHDRNRDGLDDIDALFLAHGLHADLDGDRTHDPDETPGLTSHPGRTVTVDGEAEVWPTLTPRRRLALPPAMRMQLELEPADAAIAVLVSGSAWGGYAVTPDAEGWIRLVPPPAREGASVAVVAMAPGHRTTVLWQRDAVELLGALEQHRTPFLRAQARLPTGSGTAATAAASETAGSPRWPRLTFIGGGIAALLGLVLMAIGWPRFR